MHNEIHSLLMIPPPLRMSRRKLLQRPETRSRSWQRKRATERQYWLYFWLSNLLIISSKIFHWKDHLIKWRGGNVKNVKINIFNKRQLILNSTITWNNIKTVQRFMKKIYLFVFYVHCCVCSKHTPERQCAVLTKENLLSNNVGSKIALYM